MATASTDPADYQSKWTQAIHYISPLITFGVLIAQIGVENIIAWFNTDSTSTGLGIVSMLAIVPQLCQLIVSGLFGLHAFDASSTSVV